MAKAPKTVFDLAREMVDNERVSTAKVEEIIEGIDPDRIREWIGVLEEVADAVESVAQEFDDWQNEDDREMKADARQNLLDMLDGLVGAGDSLESSGLEDLNLGK